MDSKYTSWMRSEWTSVRYLGKNAGCSPKCEGSSMNGGHICAPRHIICTSYMALCWELMTIMMGNAEAAAHHQASQRGCKRNPLLRSCTLHTQCAWCYAIQCHTWCVCYRGVFLRCLREKCQRNQRGRLAYIVCSMGIMCWRCRIRHCVRAHPKPPAAMQERGALCDAVLVPYWADITSSLYIIWGVRTSDNCITLRNGYPLQCGVWRDWENLKVYYIYCVLASISIQIFIQNYNHQIFSLHLVYVS